MSWQRWSSFFRLRFLLRSKLFGKKKKKHTVLRIRRNLREAKRSSGVIQDGRLSPVS